MAGLMSLLLLASAQLSCAGALTHAQPTLPLARVKRLRGGADDPSLLLLTDASAQLSCAPAIAHAQPTLPLARVKRLRGGADDPSLATKAIAMLALAEGAGSMIMPKEMLKLQMITDEATPSEIAFSRFLAIAELVAGVTLMHANANGADMGAASYYFLTALGLTVYAPQSEVLSGEDAKAPLIAWVVLLTALGILQIEGNLVKLSPYVAAALSIAHGLMQWLFPKGALSVYNVKGTVSDLGHALYSWSGVVFMAMGAYLAGLTNGGDDKGKEMAILSALGVAAVGTLKGAFIDAPKTGASPAMFFVWLVILAVAAAVAKS